MGVVENHNKEDIVESIPINNILQPEKKTITYKNIWEYILNNNPENKEAYINERILFYMNMHLKDADKFCLLYTSPSPRDRSLSRMPSSA